MFDHIAPEHVSHCYAGRRISEFSGKRVAVIGAGQSALESAALLHEAGSDVEIIARIPALRWIGAHSWLHHLGPVSSMMYSKHDVGPLGMQPPGRLSEHRLAGSPFPSKIPHACG